MSYHTAAYFASLATGVMTNIPPIQDDVLIIQNAHFLPNRDYDLIYAAAMSLDLNRARLSNPSMRQITLPHIRPIINAAVPPNLPGVADYQKIPFRIKGIEELGVEAFSDAAVGPENTTIVVGLMENFQPTGRGDIYTMRGTGTTTLVVNEWTSVPITWADTLPAGLYAIVGLEAISIGCQAARFIVSGQEARPGVIGGTVLANQGNEMFRKGRMGEWGRFNTVALPLVQFLSNVADTVEDVYMDIMRVG